jgi:hypothetical protein
MLVIYIQTENQSNEPPAAPSRQRIDFSEPRTHSLPPSEVPSPPAPAGGRNLLWPSTGVNTSNWMSQNPPYSPQFLEDSIDGQIDHGNNSCTLRGSSRPRQITNAEPRRQQRQSLHFRRPPPVEARISLPRKVCLHFCIQEILALFL